MIINGIEQETHTIDSLSALYVYTFPAARAKADSLRHCCRDWNVITMGSYPAPTDSLFYAVKGIMQRITNETGLNHIVPPTHYVCGIDGDGHVVRVSIVTKQPIDLNDVCLAEKLKKMLHALDDIEFPSQNDAYRKEYPETYTQQKCNHETVTFYLEMTFPL